jgi:uncharacterized Zn-binding protein involved in type VI secretion
MGLPIAILGSVGVGICTCHSSPSSQSGTVITGSGTVLANKMSVARIGDIVLAGCGHTGTLVQGSGTVTAEGIGVSVLTSYFSGCFSGTLVSGANNVMVG